MRVQKYKSKIFVGISFIIWPFFLYQYSSKIFPEFMNLIIFSFFPMIIAGFTILVSLGIREYSLKEKKT